jgi:hypothetical protein
MKMSKVRGICISIIGAVCICCAGYSQADKEPLVQTRCDGVGYYFDRGGRRMFETSYNSYKRGTFNLRRGHVWREQPGSQQRTHFHRMRSKRCCQVCQTKTEQMLHEHYTGNSGMTQWPTATGPKSGYARTKGYPNPQAPIWLRDPSDGYATPTSWQGFQ